MNLTPGKLSTGRRDQGSAFQVWGLTGGIASGKSTAARFFVEAGIPVLDADQIAREISAPGGIAATAIEKRFGTVDRAKLREIVFTYPDAKRDLEAILHPLIQTESLNRMQKLGAPLIIYEASLLVETGRYRDFDGLIVVEAPRETRIRRVVDRDRISAELAERILGSQTGDEQRRKAASYIIENSGTTEELRHNVLALAKKLKASESG